jgi:hypothetical protein
MMNYTKVFITKANGERELFDVKKLKGSLRRAGASDEVCADIVEHIVSELHDGMTTTQVYRHAFSLLRQNEKTIEAARYSVRRAVMELGPSGFPFEDYIAEIFRGQGYEAVTGLHLNGVCASHEVDMIAHRDGTYIGAEIKFHNSLGIKTDLKVALYVQARFEDLRAGGDKRSEYADLSEGWLITNTKFTHNAVLYGKCVGLKLLGWNYPRQGNLQNLIEETGVYPITVLSSLARGEKEYLLSQKKVLCEDLAKDSTLLRNAGVAPEKISTVIEESQALCSSGHRIE